MHATDVHRVSGLETWFALPGRTAPAPPRWKMFVVSAVAIYALQLVLNAVARSRGPPAAACACCSSRPPSPRS